MFAWPQIPGYDLIHPLGGSGQNSVVRARERQSGNDVAIKISQQRQILAREAAAGLAVRHPHLVHLRAAHLAEQPYFVVLDLLAGSSLRSILHQHYALELAVALRVARQVAEALAALHRGGFIHGDVKPDNVQWVNAENVVLIDLGFSQRGKLGFEADETNSILGTPNYLAPECCSPNGDKSERSDIFSFGVMLFEMLTGELPYEPGTVVEVLNTHQKKVPIDLRESQAHGLGGWCDYYNGCWRFDLATGRRLRCLCKNSST